MARSRTPGDYEVGYKKPPKHTRYRPGQSGNISGRPKRKPEPPPAAGVSEDDLMLLRILDEEVCVAVDGRKQRITRREAMLRGLVDQATAGDIRATRIVQERDVQARKARDTTRSAEGGVDTAALTLELAEIIRSRKRPSGDTQPQDTRSNDPPARPAEGRAGQERRHEDAEGEGQFPPAIGEEEEAANVPECPRDTSRSHKPDGPAPVARAASAPPRQPPRVRRKPHPNEPLIRDPRPLTW